jgi:hypothetical protein
MNQALWSVSRGCARRSFILSRSTSGATRKNVNANTAMNPRTLTHVCWPIRRNTSSATSPNPNEITNSARAQNGVGHRWTWQFGHSIPDRPAGVQSELAGIGLLHCGQVIASCLTKELAFSTGAEGPSHTHSTPRIYHKFRPKKSRQLSPALAHPMSSDRNSPGGGYRPTSRAERLAHAAMGSLDESAHSNHSVKINLYVICIIAARDILRPRLPEGR